MQLFFAERFLSNNLVLKLIFFSCIKLNNLRDFFDHDPNTKQEF